MSEYRGAAMSEDGRYRYVLERTWQEGVERLKFVMLNPSTADATADDPTIRRCVAFAKRGGYGGILVVNLFAYRATNPAMLALTEDPIGPENDEFIGKVTAHGTVVVAWGADTPRARTRQVMRRMLGRTLICLGTTKDGSPRHPLYVKADQPLVPWEPTDDQLDAWARTEAAQLARGSRR